MWYIIFPSDIFLEWPLLALGGVGGGRSGRGNKAVGSLGLPRGIKDEDRVGGAGGQIELR